MTCFVKLKMANKQYFRFHCRCWARSRRYRSHEEQYFRHARNVHFEAISDSLPGTAHGLYHMLYRRGKLLKYMVYRTVMVKPGYNPRIKVRKIGIRIEIGQMGWGGDGDRMG